MSAVRPGSLALLTFVWLVAAAPVTAQDVPSHDDVADFFATLRADLFTCGRGWHGSLDLEVVFARTGAVTDVTVTGDGAPDHVLSCVRSVVRGGHIRPFEDPAAVVEHSLRL